MPGTKNLDPKVFRQLYATHVGFVQFIARRAGCRDGAMDDVVQETFLRLYQNPPLIHDEKVVRSWLGTTARRVITDLARKNWREKSVSEPKEGEGVGVGSLWFRNHDDMERELELLAVRDLVDEIASLPGGEDFRAFYVDGLKAREIAAKRGEAISTVTTRLSRLRERFREQLKMRLEQMEAKRA